MQPSHDPNGEIQMSGTKPVPKTVSSNHRDDKGLKKCAIIKRSIVIDRHKTSISLEDDFWAQLKDIAHARHSNLSKLVAQIDQTRTGNLSSAIRVFILEHLRGKEK